MTAENHLQAFKASIVRIYDASGAVVGAGFLVSNEYVLTCAHVITQALRIEQNTQEKPTESIHLDFPGIESGEKSTANVVFWQPVSLNESVEDIAGLKLNSKLPDAIQTIKLVTAENLWENPIRIFGFPKGHKNGVWASGVLRDKNAKGWLQMEDVKVTGYQVEPGFSGAPVWDDKSAGVVGMAVAAEKRRENVKAAFIIPTQLLVKAWSILKTGTENPTEELPPWIVQRLQEKLTVLIERPQEIQQIVDHLLDEQRKPSENIIVMWGPGGCGKTALALLTCCVSEILQHFSGGIFWVDLGEGVNILQGMKTLYKQLTGSDSSSSNLRDIATELVFRWGKKPCLVILDDIKSKSDFDQFYSSTNEHCTWLITARIKNIFAGRNFIEIQVNYFQNDEPELLLWHELSRKEKGEVDREKVKELVDLLYEWPLLISLIGNKIHQKIDEGYSPNDALNFMLKRLKEKGWVIFESEIDENLRISLMSLKEDRQEYFKELAIFPESVSIPISILEKFWNLGELDVEDLCGTLYASSLLEKFYPSQGKIRLNSVFRHYLIQTKEIQEKWRDLNKKLLESYKREYYCKKEKELQLTKKLPEELLNILENEDEKTYLERFYQYHWEQAGY